MTGAQAVAVVQMRRLAAPSRFRVIPDAEGWPIIPGRLGQIEWYCDGVDCHSCPMPGEFTLAVSTERPRLHAKLSAIPGLVRWQVGDEEFRGVFPPETLDQVAGVIRARRRARRIMTPERLAALEVARQKAREGYPRSTSRPQDRVVTPGQAYGPGSGVRRRLERSTLARSRPVAMPTETA